MGTSVYFVSKLFNVFIATVIAQKRNDANSVLIFINQPANGKDICGVLDEWKGNPFSEVYYFEGQVSGKAKKARLRKDNFVKIKDIIDKYKPDNIFTGNDRRIEFQYAMHIASGRGEVVGHYMDEGTFTYLGRTPTNIIKQKLDNYIKKVVYGGWWNEPETIGASTLIQHVFAAFPELVDDRLKSKEMHKLDREGFQSLEIVTLCELILDQHGLEKKAFEGINGLITLPYESLYLNDKEYRDKILSIVSKLEGPIAVKYHPRDKELDALGLVEEGAVLLPGGAPFETMLPLLEPHTKIVGDVSSTLITAKWVRPELEVVSFRGGKWNAGFEKLFSNIGITLL